jgi:GntR family transcriptional regulator of vanillate catabolism
MAPRHSNVTVRLREMILNGAFAADERITEMELAKSLGVSRTPVRLALGALEHEGLVEGAPNRGFTVRSFSVGEISEAIDVRGVLEGMAARLVAEQGLPQPTGTALRQCLAAGDALLAKGQMEVCESGDYAEMNQRFHAAIIDAAGNAALARALDLNNRVPFAAAGAVAFQDARRMYRVFSQAHQQHHAIVEALTNGEGARAEALMREHALSPKGSLNLLDLADNSADAADVPGLRLVRG